MSPAVIEKKGSKGNPMSVTRTSQPSVRPNRGTLSQRFFVAAAATAALGLFATSPTPAHAQPAGVAPPARTDFALSGTMLVSGNFGDYLACQAKCKSTASCTGYSFDPGAKTSCALLTGALTDVPVKGAASCRMPCEARPSVFARPAQLKVAAPNRALPATPAPAAAPPPPAAAPAPPAPASVPAVKAKIAMPEQGQFVSIGTYAEVLFWSQSVMIQNGVRLTAANPAIVNIKPLNAAGFPSGTMNVVVTGSRNEFPGKSIVMTSGATTISCPLAQFPATWRCVLSLSVGVVGQQQQVSMTTNGTTVLDAISIE